MEELYCMKVMFHFEVAGTTYHFNTIAIHTCRLIVRDFRT